MFPGCAGGRQSLPNPGETRESSFWRGRPQTFECLEFFGTHEGGHGPAVTRDHDGIAVFSGADILAEFGFYFSNGSHA